jgi:hypothetical protein
MSSKPKVLFWITSFFTHFAIAYYLQSKLNANFFGIFDVNLKFKNFIENQNLVQFKKNWFYHDYIEKYDQKIDIDYLTNFENTHNIGLWNVALNERHFYKHNRFYKFQREEILSILVDELKLFEQILDESKPDYFLTFNPVLHHQKLFLDVCRVRGIKVLNACRTGISDQTTLVEDGETFDLDFNLTIDDYYEQISKKPQKSDQNDVYDIAHENWIKGRGVSFLNKFSGLKNYLFDSDDDLIKSNFMYYGRNKFKVIRDALWIEYKRKSNYNFLNKNSILSPSLDIPYVLFPMNIVEESSLFHYAPFYTDQVEVIRHIAKSIPIDHMLYVKEHPAAGIRRWNEINYYKEIMDLPNVKLIHPKVDNEILVKNSKLLISIRGTSILKAVKFGIPAITFGKQPYQIIPSVLIVNSLSSLPTLIKKALKFKTNPSDYQKFKKYFDIFGYNFDFQGFELKRNESFFSGNGVYSNVEILEKDVENFLNVNKDMFSDVVQAHLKFLS